MASPEVLVRAHSLSKKSDDFVAVNGIDFEVYRGECCGFLEAQRRRQDDNHQDDIKMIQCFWPLTSGDMTVSGLDVLKNARETKDMIGVAPQGDNLGTGFAVLLLTHSVNLTRGLVIGNIESSLLLSIIWIAAVTPVFFVLAVNLMRKRLIR